MSGASEALGAAGQPCGVCGRAQLAHESGPQDHIYERPVEFSPCPEACHDYPNCPCCHVIGSPVAKPSLDETRARILRENGLERTPIDDAAHRGLLDPLPARVEPTSPALAYRTLIESVEPLRDGTMRTPVRAAAAWQEMTRGYGADLDAMMTVFPADGADEIVVVTGIPVYSLCEHHLLPFLGTAAIAYLPQRTILGLSKFARIVDAYSRRLQVQERLTTEIADALEHYLSPRAVAVVIRARHMCMEIRGVQVPGAQTTTSVNRGLFREDARARAEALSLMAG